MPESIDRIGRAHEWLTAYNLDGNENSKIEAEEYMENLSELDKQRVLLGAKKTSEKIKELSSEKIIEKVNVVGEENKKHGEIDFDVLIQFDDETEEGYSLKIQHNCKGVNVRNPTLNSLCEAFTGKKFEDFLTSSEKKQYDDWGILYSKDKIESKVIGTWGAEKFGEILKKVLDESPVEFFKTISQEVRLKTNLIITVVDKKAKFNGYVTKFAKGFAIAKKSPNKIKVTSSGISVFVNLGDDCLFKIDIYMMSNSSGKGKKLRIAIRPDFDLD